MNLVTILFTAISGLIQSSRGRCLVMLALALSAMSLQVKGDDALDIKKLVEETDDYEKEQRAALKLGINEERESTILKLRRMEESHRDEGERITAKRIRKAIKKLEEKVNIGKDIVKTTLESSIFEYDKEYLFKSDSIDGRITFLADGKVNAIYKNGESPSNVTWVFEEKSDHILINDAGELGIIYISEIPYTEKRSIMIRLGGKLRHHVVTGTHQ